MFRIAYIVTHPIQYQAPLLRYLSQAGGVDLQVFFLSDFSLHEHYEEAFNQNFRWDVALTDGYKWEVLPRMCLGSSTVLQRWSLVSRFRQRLRAGNFDAVWVHGWGHVGLCQAVREAAALGLPVLIRGESTPETNRHHAMRKCLRDRFYHWLFRRIAGFLYIGTRNREFYKQYKLPDNRLFSVPYAVDNVFFRVLCSQAALKRETFRRSLGLRRGRPVILFAAKLIPPKAPEELLAAFNQVYRRTMNSSAPYLLFVGDGPLRGSLQQQAKPFGDAVRFLGFRNQSELPAVYDLCDVFVLPSQFEPWGLVLNEVMNAGRPVIVSSRAGAAADLVGDGDNGFIYPSGNVGALASRLSAILESPSRRMAMGERSFKRISSWNFEADRLGLLEALSTVCQKRISVARATA